jgi:hypothetical protein
MDEAAKEAALQLSCPALFAVSVSRAHRGVAGSVGLSPYLHPVRLPQVPFHEAGHRPSIRLPPEQGGVPGDGTLEVGDRRLCKHPCETNGWVLPEFIGRADVSTPRSMAPSR